MHPPPIETPSEVIDALKRGSAIAPAKSKCEVFKNAMGGPQCLVCTSPIRRDGDQVAVFALLGVDIHERRVLVERLGGLIQMTKLKMPKTWVSSTEKVTLMMAPWMFRGEFRALVATAIATHPVHGVSHESIGAPTKSYPDVGFLEVDQQYLKGALCDFVDEFDSPFRSIVRKTIKSKGKKTNRWRLPLQCVVEEEVSADGVMWDICFPDMEILERANTLIDARLDSPKTTLLKPAPQTVSDDVQTNITGILVYAADNSRAARSEMAVLLRHVLTSLDCLDFRSAPNHLAVTRLFC